MTPVDYLIIFAVGTIIGIAVGYIRKSKKKGTRCIGCPNGGSCSGNCTGCSTGK